MFNSVYIIYPCLQSRYYIGDRIDYFHLKICSVTNPYLHTHYHIDKFNQPILIGQKSDELDLYLEKENARTWAFITAYNPMSVVLNPEENERRNQELQKKINYYHYLMGEGRDPSGEWIPERSFLVLDISRENAISLACSFEQKAIVFGNKGFVAELIELDYPKKAR